MKKNIFLLILVILGISGFSLDTEKYIGTITIEGLKRTKKSVIYNILEVGEGDNFALFDENKFNQDLLKTGILRPGRITYTEFSDHIDINIEIKEKWTLIPIPVVKVSGDDKSYGFVLMEQNFLGLRKQLFLQTGYSDLAGLTGGIIYRDVDLLPFNLFMLTGISLVNDTDLDYIHASGFFGAGKEFDGFALQSQLKCDNFLFDNSDTNGFFSNALNFSYKNLYYTSTIRTGTSLSVILTPGWDFTKEEMTFKLNSSMEYSKKMSNGLVIGGSMSSQFFDSPELLENYWGGSDNGRTLEPVLCDQYLGGSVFVEYQFLDFKISSVSVMVQYEIGGYQQNKDAWDLYTGPGAGLRGYLKKIAMPALGIDVAYNMLEDNFLFSVTMGIKKK